MADKYLNESGLGRVWHNANLTFCTQEQVAAAASAMGVSVTGLYSQRSPSTQLLDPEPSTFDLSAVQRMWVDGERVTPELSHVFGTAGIRPVWVSFAGTEVPQYAFAQTDIESARVGGLMETVGVAAFGECPHLEIATLGAGITSIRDLAFVNNPLLRVVTCHAVTPPTLGAMAFYGIHILAVLRVPSGSVAAYQASDWSNYFYNISVL